jgi:hypothetical protein
MPSREDLERDVRRIFAEVFGPRYSSTDSDDITWALARAWSRDFHTASATETPDELRSLLDSARDDSAVAAIGAVAFTRPRDEREWRRIAKDAAERLDRGIRYLLELEPDL